MATVYYGDLIEYDLRASHGGKVERAYVIGEMSYSENGSHVLVANPGQLGMPIHTAHCKRIAGGLEDIAAPIRAAYLKQWPNALR